MTCSTVLSVASLFNLSQGLPTAPDLHCFLLHGVGFTPALHGDSRDRRIDPTLCPMPTTVQGPKQGNGFSVFWSYVVGTEVCH